MGHVDSVRTAQHMLGVLPKFSVFRFGQKTHWDFRVWILG